MWKHNQFDHKCDKDPEWAVYLSSWGRWLSLPTTIWLDKMVLILREEWPHSILKPLIHFLSVRIEKVCIFVMIEYVSLEKRLLVPRRHVLHGYSSFILTIWIRSSFGFFTTVMIFGNSKVLFLLRWPIKRIIHRIVICLYFFVSIIEIDTLHLAQ